MLGRLDVSIDVNFHHPLHKERVQPFISATYPHLQKQPTSPPYLMYQCSCSYSICSDLTAGGCEKNMRDTLTFHASRTTSTCMHLLSPSERVPNGSRSPNLSESRRKLFILRTAFQRVGRAGATGSTPPETPPVTLCGPSTRGVKWPWSASKPRIHIGKISKTIDMVN